MEKCGNCSSFSGMELTLGGKAIPHGWMPSALTLAPDMRLPTPVIRGAEDNEESRHWSDS